MTPAVAKESVTVSVELDSRPDSLPLVRAVMSAIAEQLRFDPELLNDLKTAVSEACNNVVMHAYEGGVGRMLVAVAIDGQNIEVTVRDHGTGIHHLARSEERMGVGLAVISALADRAEFRTPPDGGTEVSLVFSGREVDVSGLGRASDAQAPSQPEPALDGDVIVTLSSVEMMGEVLGRVARVLAADARFSLDRFSDVYLVADAIAAHVRSAAGGNPIRFAVHTRDRRMELAIGPLRLGSGAALQDAVMPEQRRRSPLTMLVDALAVETSERYELLRVVIGDAPAASAQSR